MAYGRQQFYSAFRQVVAALSFLNNGWLADQLLLLIISLSTRSRS